MLLDEEAASCLLHESMAELGVAALVCDLLLLNSGTTASLPSDNVITLGVKSNLMDFFDLIDTGGSRGLCSLRRCLVEATCVLGRAFRIHVMLGRLLAVSCCGGIGLL